MNMKIIRVAVIGCGRIAQRRHIPEYDAHRQAEIVGYFDYDRSKAEDMVRKFGGRIYDSVDELLADPALDAVSVCVANNAHASISIKALESGKNVLVEKPMAMNFS